MTQETLFSAATSSLLPDAFSHALMQIVHRVQPSIVHVFKEGRGAGTGIVWKADGSIITNHHVVPDDTTKVEVHLADGRKLDAKLIARNPKLDLAMLHIQAGDLDAVPIGDSAKLRVGEWVFAVGNPWGQRGVVTAGIVSSVSSTKAVEGDRSDSEQAIRYVKSDVILAPGNSGGPLLDADGRVVGVNAMVFGGDLAVSIPSNVVISWIESLPEPRNIALGIELEAVDLPVAIREQILRSAQDDKRDSGLLVVAINPDQLNGHSDSASVLIGDLLLDAAGKPIDDTAMLLDILNRKDPQETLPVRLVRGGSFLTLDVAVAALERKG